MKITLILILSILFLKMAQAQSPGNVSSNLQLWLDANIGVSTTGANVSSWTNQAATLMTTQASKVASANVTLATGDINYNSTLVFDGTANQVLNGEYTTAPSNPSLIFAVVQKVGATPECCLNPYSQSPAGAAGIAYGTGGANRYSLDGPGFGCSATPEAVNVLGIVRADYASVTSAVGGFSAFNGTTNTACTAGSLPIPDGGFQVGGRTYPTFTSRIFSGKIAELIHYNSNTITAVQVNQIESYLAIKYGITLSTNYLNSAGAAIYDVSTFENDIIGISRDDNSGLEQKQSHQENDSTRIYISSLTSQNVNNTGSFSGNLQSLVMGHNNAALKSEGSAEHPVFIGIFSRIEREWKITNTSFDGTFSLDIKLDAAPINPSNLRLLVDTDDDFTNATMISPVISFSGGVITISNLSTANFPTNATRFFTIVSLDSQTPLPIELMNFNVTSTSNEYVHLNWQTASEINNDYFTIERSLNGHDWEIVSTVDGAGNSSTTLTYSTVDNTPYSGVSYYRLKQTDFDGVFEYSEVRTAELEPLEGGMELYPNPIGDAAELQVRFYTTELTKEFVIMDMQSRSVLQVKEDLKSTGWNTMSIDIRVLPAGTYLILDKEGNSMQFIKTKE